jgi:hypothetical protein
MTIDTEGRIDRLLRRLARRRPLTANDTLYAEAIKTKLREARFSLGNLRQLTPLGDQVQDATTIPNTQGLLSVSEQVAFYCTGFWDSLRSALDILAQFVNEICSLGISERDVDIKSVAEKVKSATPESSLGNGLDGLLNSSAFKQLEDYRNCSTHRRPPFIQTRTVTTSVTGTRGYNYSSSSQQRTVVERDLCSNPWARKPRVYPGKRPVVEYNEQLLQRIRRKIDAVISRLP